MSDLITPHPTTAPEDGEISFIAIASGLLRNWKLVLLFPFLFSILIGIKSLSKDRNYVASASFMPEGAQTRGGGGAAALAQQFGVNVGSDRPSLSPQFYSDLVRSRAILRPTVMTKYKVGSREATLVSFLEKEDEPNPVEEAVDELRDMIGTSVARGTSVVTLSVSAREPALAEQIATRLIALLHEFNIKSRQANAREEARFVGGRLQEALAELNAAENRLEQFLNSNRKFGNAPELNFRHERLQREVAMRQQLYTSLLTSQEQARIDGIRDTPLLTVIDDPAGSAKPLGRGTVRRVILAFIVGLVFSIVLVLVIEFLRRGRHANNPDYEELQLLARAAWADIPRPGRRAKGK